MLLLSDFNESVLFTKLCFLLGIWEPEAKQFQGGATEFEIALALEF